ncbi:MAG: TRAP transporter small permease [Planctomycetota bacterium]
MKTPTPSVIWDRVIGATGGVGALLILAMPFLIAWGVFRRYVLNSPVLYVEEYTGYMLVGAAFLGLAYGLKNKIHISIDILVNRLPPKATRWLKVAAIAASLPFTGVLIWSSWRLVRETFVLGTKSISVYRTPLYPLFALMALGFTLLGVQVLLELIQSTREK